MLDNFYFKHFLIIGNFGSMGPESETTFPFQYNIIFEIYQSLEAPSSTPGGDRHVPPLIFCTKFNSEQLLFEEFFYIISNFCGVLALKWTYFLLSMCANILHDIFVIQGYQHLKLIFFWLIRRWQLEVLGRRCRRKDDSGVQANTLSFFLLNFRSLVKIFSSLNKIFFNIFLP